MDSEAWSDPGRVLSIRFHPIESKMVVTPSEKFDGFISIERFSNTAEEGKVLSLSFWRDEKAINDWRSIESHRLAQKKVEKEYSVTID
jgi:heme-degrading monooxygenase HmoA